MLTVKHLVHGEEHIYLAPHGVQFVGELSLSGAGPHLAIPLAPLDADPKMGVPVKALYRGFAYVMNPAGATVGSYSLGEPPMSLAATADTGADTAAYGRQAA